MSRPASSSRARALTIAVFVAWSMTVVTGGLALMASGAERAKASLDPAAMRPELGRAYEIDLVPDVRWWRAARGDSLAAGERSDLVLVDSQGALGPAHARHPEIRELGGGRYSHWHGRLIFSTRDGSDPRTNGEHYEVAYTLGASPWLEWTATAALLAALVLSWRRFVSTSEWRARLAFFAVAAMLIVAWNGVIGAFVPSWIAVQEDSMSYLNGDPMRTIGYPLILRAVIAVHGDLEPLVRVQVNALLLALIGLAYSVAAALGRSIEVDARGEARADSAIRARAPAWGAGVLALLMMATAGRVFETSFTLMADGPFIALSCAAAAIMGALARRASVRLAIAAGLVIGAAILVRPIGFAFIPVLVLPWWWHRRARLVPAALVPAGAVVVAAAAANYSERGTFALSTMGPISLAGHVAWMISPQTVPSEPEIASRIERRLAPVIERRPALAWPLEYYLYTSDEYNELLYRNLLPEVDAWIEARAGADVDDSEARERERSRVLRALGVEPLLHRPGAYVRHVVANVVGAWHWSGRAAPIAPALARAVRPGVECLGRLEPAHARLFERWIDAPEPDRSWQRMLPWERLRHPIDARPRMAALAGMAATLVGLALVPFTRTRRGSGGDDADPRLPALRFLGALSLMAWGSIVLIALSATMIFRYVDALDPLVTSAVVMAAVSAWRWCSAHARMRRHAAASRFSG